MSKLARQFPMRYGIIRQSSGLHSTLKDELIAALAKHMPPIYLTKDDIAAIIAGSDKKRFEILNGKIRATYGHSTTEKIKF